VTLSGLEAGIQVISVPSDEAQQDSQTLVQTVLYEMISSLEPAGVGGGGGEVRIFRSTRVRSLLYQPLPYSFISLFKYK
jgi:hypothetical protein